MKRKRYSVEQIVVAVKQHEQGTSAPDTCRRLGIVRLQRKSVARYQLGHYSVSQRRACALVKSPVRH